MCLQQPSATSPLFFDNLNFEHFDKSVNHESRLTLLSKCSTWRLSKNRWLVADCWPIHARLFVRSPKILGEHAIGHKNGTSQAPVRLVDVREPAVGNSSPFLTNLPLRFSQNCEPRIVVEIIGKIVKRQVYTPQTKILDRRKICG